MHPFEFIYFLVPAAPTGGIDSVDNLIVGVRVGRTQLEGAALERATRPFAEGVAIKIWLEEYNKSFAIDHSRVGLCKDAPDTAPDFKRGEHFVWKVKVT